MRLARATGRNDVCALPYGINTVSLFAHVFLVMLPAKLAAQAAGAADPGAGGVARGPASPASAPGPSSSPARFVAERVRRADAARRAALDARRHRARPSSRSASSSGPSRGRSSASTTLGDRPAHLLRTASASGAGSPAASWRSRSARRSPGPPASRRSARAPPGAGLPSSGAGARRPLRGARRRHLGRLPLGHPADGALQRRRLAPEHRVRRGRGRRVPDAAARSRSTGVGTLAAALFGSCFPTTIYIGHPGWKALGARAGYSVLNGVFITLVCLTGTLALDRLGGARSTPGMAIVLWIGIVITAQAFQATPRAHAPAVVVGLLPGLGGVGRAAWRSTGCAPRARRARAAAVRRAADRRASSRRPVDRRRASRSSRDSSSARAARRGDGRASSSGASVRRRRWCLAGAALSAVGLIHSYRWTPADTVLSLTPAWPWALGYLVMAACFAVAPWVTETVDDGAGGH